MKIKLIAPARKQEWGESFWELKSFVKLTGRKAAGVLLALPTLAALTPPDIEVVITDENIEAIEYDEEVDLVGISFLTSLAPRAYEIADNFRAKGIKVVLGGIHATMLPEEAIKHADSVVIGEAEGVWVNLIEDLKTGKLKKFYKTENLPSLETSPIPRWDLIKSENYCYFTVQTTRGCPYNCDFCSVHEFNGRKPRKKNIENIINEIKLLKKIDSRKSIFFADDNFLGNLKFTKELISAIKPLGIKYWIQASINKLEDENLLKELYSSGCRSIFIGFESLSQKSLESVNKKLVNNVSEYEKTIKKVHNSGMWIFGSFIFGNDCDDENIFEETASFITKTNIAFSMANILTPLPGTRLYKVLESEHRITTKEWQWYNCESLCIKLKSINNSDFREKHNKLLINLNSYQNTSKRLLYLWNQGVLIRDDDKKMFTKGRILAAINIIKWSKNNWKYAIKDIWNKHNVSVMSILMAVSCSDYSKKVKHYK